MRRTLRLLEVSLRHPTTRVVISEFEITDVNDVKFKGVHEDTVASLYDVPC